MAKKYYQTEWQGIRFSDISKLSSKNVADSDFYQAFYAAFFNNHKSWNDLSISWREQKEAWADFIISKSGVHSKILSLGCGLGFMEYYIKNRYPHCDFYIHEVAPAAWHWVAPEFDTAHKIVGLLPECIPVEMKFDMVYMAAVEYALSDSDLLVLLTAIRPFLKNEGSCLIVSASFLSQPVTSKDFIISFLKKGKDLLRKMQIIAGLKKKGQLWGWKRSRNEFWALMHKAGYIQINDGFLHASGGKAYWISGQ